MADVFLSYKSEDRAVAERFAVALGAEGMTVWWDPVLRTGDTYDEVIEHNLFEACVVVVLWSAQSVKSKWVRAEATIGERKGGLLPVQIEDCSRPIAFELVHTADLRGWAGDRSDERWNAFVADVKEKLRALRIGDPTVSATPDASTIESLYWASIKDGTDVEDFEAYMLRYPHGEFLELARNKLRAERDRRERLANDEEARANAERLALEEERERIADAAVARHIEERLEADRRVLEADAARAASKGTRSAGALAEPVKLRPYWSELLTRVGRTPWWLIGMIGASVLTTIAIVSLGRSSPQNAEVTALECEASLPSETSALSEARIRTLQGLEFENVAVVRDFDGVTPVLRVTGDVINKTSTEILVPRIRVALLNSNGGVICLAIETAAQSPPLAVNSAREFLIRVRNAPDSATELEATFEGMPQGVNDAAAGVVLPSELERAAQSGNLVAQYELALRHLSAGQTQDGVALLRSSADQGFAMAQYRLAKLYENGEGVATNLNLARQWTERAAASGNRRAMHDLGVYFARGEGTAMDETAAFRWFSQAAELGVADSQYNLGLLYEQGRGVAASRSDALFWFLIAARQGDHEANRRADIVQRELTNDEVESVRARVAAFQPRAANPIANGEFGSQPWR